MNGFQLPRVANSNNPLRLAVFISGSGSGMAALLSHQQSSNCAHSTELVVSNIQGVGGLQLAETFGVITFISVTHFIFQGFYSNDPSKG